MSNTYCQIYWPGDCAGYPWYGKYNYIESSLSFLGFGIQPPTPSWGYDIDQGRQYLLAGAWWWSAFPGLAIMALVLGFNLLGDGLRDALDPRQSGGEGR